MSFFSNLWTNVLSFVKGAAPIAEAVGTVIGNPAVVAGAKAAEVVETVAENSTAAATQVKK